MDEELIFYTLSQLMSLVRWTRAGDPEPNTNAFITVSRRVRLFSDVPGAQQAACFQAEWASTSEQKSNLPYKNTLDANWIVYQCVARDTAAVGATENNLILGGIRSVLEPSITDPGYQDRRNTLGGLVYHCYISGRIFKDPGDIDGQGMMVIPIKLLVP